MILREDEDMGTLVVDIAEFKFCRHVDWARQEDVDGDGIVEPLPEPQIAGSG